MLCNTQILRKVYERLLYIEAEIEQKYSYLYDLIYLTCKIGVLIYCNAILQHKALDILNILGTYCNATMY